MTLLLTTNLAHAQARRPRVEAVPSADSHAALAAGFMASWREHGQFTAEELPYLWFLSFWDVEDDARLMDERRFLAFWCNQMSLSRKVRLPREVPGSGGRLVWVDVTWYGWNTRARDAVGARDPFTREPGVTFTAATALRTQMGIRAEQAKDGSRPVIGMVNARWFVRETFTLQRSSSYHDLLFARFRFPDEGAATYGEPRWRTERRVVTYRGPGDYVYPDDTGRTTPARLLTPGAHYYVDLKFRARGEAAKGAGAFVDFPKNAKDLERAFGVDKLVAFGQETKIALDFGAVAAGGANYPGEGSFVALSDRLVVVFIAPWGPFMRTYDAFETTGAKNYKEVVIFKGGKFRVGDRADAVFDAGEILFALPNGGQGGALINAKEEIIATADGRIAQDTAYVDAGGKPLLNPGVQTYARCGACHAQTGGFITPKDLVSRSRKAGNVRKFYAPTYAAYQEAYPGATKADYRAHVKAGKLKQERFEDFFAALGKKMRPYQAAYEDHVAECTVHPRLSIHLPPEQALPWSGVKVAEMFTRLQREYDAPITGGRAARLMGLPPAAFRWVASRSPKTDDLDLLQGLTVPSRTFEVDVFGRLSAILAAERGKPEYRALYK